MDAGLKKRRSLKGKLTRLETVLGAPTAASLDQRSVERYKSQLEVHWKELNEVHEEIGQHCVDEDYAIHQTEFDQLAARIEALQNKLPAGTGQQGGNNAAATPPTPATNGTTVKLPTLDLPTFSGNLHEWTSYCDLFTATIHGNTQLAGSQKLQYLKASLRGEAAALLQSIQVTDDNFAVAWDILTKRYQNRREIITAHLKKLCGQPTLNSESPAALRKLIDNTNETVRALRVLEVPVEHWDLILVHLVAERLDHDSRRQWELSLQTTEAASYDDFMAFLEVRARALITCAAPRTTRSSPTSQRPNAPADWRWPAKAAFHADVYEETCCICKEPHAVYKCDEFLQCSIEERRSLVKEHALCFNCLSDSHTWRRCKSSACKKCGARHHTLLHQPTHKAGHPFESGHNVKDHHHDVRYHQEHVAEGATNLATYHGSHGRSRSQLERFPGEPINAASQHGMVRYHGERFAEDASNSFHGGTSQRSQFPEAATNVSSHHASVTQRQQSTPQVLLPTALVRIRDAFGNQQECRALLDSGSQTSFVTENCVQRLGLQKQPASLVVTGLSSSSVDVAHDCVNISVSSCVENAPDLPLNAFILTSVTGHLPTEPCEPSSWAHLPRVKLADPKYHRPNNVDILLGAEIFSEIIREGLHRGPKGTPTAQDSLFGWLISGQTNAVQGATSDVAFPIHLELSSPQPEEVLTTKVSDNGPSPQRKMTTYAQGHTVYKVFSWAFLCFLLFVFIVETAIIGTLFQGGENVQCLRVKVLYALTVMGKCIVYIVVSTHGESFIDGFSCPRWEFAFFSIFQPCHSCSGKPTPAAD